MNSLFLYVGEDKDEIHLFNHMKSEEKKCDI